jgi:hypothetical protein
MPAPCASVVPRIGLDSITATVLSTADQYRGETRRGGREPASMPLEYLTRSISGQAPLTKLIADCPCEQFRNGPR